MVQIANDRVFTVTCDLGHDLTMVLIEELGACERALLIIKILNLLIDLLAETFQGLFSLCC